MQIFSFRKWIGFFICVLDCLRGGNRKSIHSGIAAPLIDTGKHLPTRTSEVKLGFTKHFANGKGKENGRAVEEGKFFTWSSPVAWYCIYSDSTQGPEEEAALSRIRLRVPVSGSMAGCGSRWSQRPSIPCKTLNRPSTTQPSKEVGKCSSCRHFLDHSRRTLYSWPIRLKT